MSNSQVVKYTGHQILAARDESEGTFQDARSKASLMKRRQAKYGPYVREGIGVLLVLVFPDGRKILADGIGRARVIELAGVADELFWVEEMRVEDDAEAYRVFSLRNNQVSLTPQQTATAGLIAGDEYYVNVSAAAEAAGFTIGTAKDNNGRITMKSAEQIYALPKSERIFPLLADGRRAMNSAVAAIVQFVERKQAQNANFGAILRTIESTPFTYASGAQGTAAYLNDLIENYC